MSNLNFQCVDCRDVFTVDEVAEHAKDGVCVEWENHQMFEANFRVYTDEDEARDLQIEESRAAFWRSKRSS